MRTRIWHSDWKPRWLIRCVSAALLSFMDKQDNFLCYMCHQTSTEHFCCREIIPCHTSSLSQCCYYSP